MFTECLAAALRDDPELARRFAVRLCGHEIDGTDVGASAIDVATQVGFPASVDIRACCVDLVLTRDGTIRVGVENKLFATEARGPDGVRDQHRRHFLWSDFYLDAEICARSGPMLTRALLELFRHYGFEPPKPEIGDLADPDKALAEANRRNFAKLWEVTRTELTKAGWTSITPGSIAELYVDGGAWNGSSEHGSIRRGREVCCASG